MAFFSIVIPTYNSSVHLNKCLSSISSQNFSDFDIVIQDGGSTDGTLLLIDKFIQENPRIAIRFESEKDKGVYDAMNKGIKNSSGEYVYFLGSDDVLYNNRVLEDVYTALEKVNFPDFAYGNVLLGDTNFLHNGEYDICKLFHVNICHQSIFYKRRIFDKVGLFELSYPAFSDWHFNFRCFANQSVSKQYISVLIAVYCLDGLSSRTKDPLVNDKEAVFEAIAKEAPRDQYLKLKRYMVNTSSIKGKLSYIQYDALYALAYNYRKLKKHLKK